jgi:hypothetical protein
MSAAVVPALQSFLHEAFPSDIYMMLQSHCVSPILGVHKTHCQIHIHRDDWSYIWPESCSMLLPGLPCHQVPDGIMFLSIAL